MKKILFTSMLLFSSLLINQLFAQTANCDIKALKKEGIAQLSPFYYSSAKVSKIEYQNEQLTKEIEVPLFKGEQYRMVFNRKALPQEVEIQVYDQDKSHESRKALFSSKGDNRDILYFEPEKSKRHYVTYTIPAVTETVEAGCLVFVLGYQLTFVDTSKAEE